MAFITNSLNFPNLTSKGTPVGADLLMIADSAASNAIKQATISSILAAGTTSALVFIATASGAASSTIDFSNNLSATYDNYLVMIEGWQASTNSTAQMLVGTGAGPTYQTSNYVGPVTQLTTTSVTSTLTAAASVSLSGSLSSTGNRTGSAQVFISNANNVADDKGVNSVLNINSVATLCNVQWKGTGPLTSLRFLQSGGTITTGIFKLYGIKNS